MTGCWTWQRVRIRRRPPTPRRRTADLLLLLDEIRFRYAIPAQSCVLPHVTTTIELIERGAPVDLVFQSVGGTQGANSAFGVDIALLREGLAAGRSLRRGTVGDNMMYLETGQGSALSSGAHLGMGGQPVDQQTLETRAYAVARDLEPLLVNTVVGFIGPEYLYDGKQIVRAAWRTISAASYWAYRWASTCATPTTPKPTRTTWTFW